jgi:hypothetical protein
MRAYHRAGGQAAWAALALLSAASVPSCGPRSAAESATVARCAERLPPEPPKFAAPLERAAPPSDVVLELAADRRRIAREIEQRVPVLLASAKRRPIGTPGEATYRVTRGGFDVRVVGERLVVSSPINVELEVCKPLGPICISYGSCNPRLLSTVSVPAALDAGYALGRSNVAIQVTRSCSILGIDVGGHLHDAATREAKNVKDRVDSLLPDLAPIVKEAHRLSSLPLSVSSTTCVRLTLQRVLQQRPQAQGELFSTRFKAIANIEIEEPCQRSDAPPPTPPLPPLEVVDPFDPKISVKLPIRMSWDYVAAELSRSLGEGAGHHRITRARARPTQQSGRSALALGLTLDGPSCGEAWFTADPYYDASNARIRVRAVALAPGQAASRSLLDDGIERRVERLAAIALPVNLVQAQGLLKLLADRVERPKGVELALELEPVRIERVLGDEGALAPIAELAGSARITLR